MLVFLFTDIEGSSKLWEEHTEAMTPVIARHDEILREQVEAAGGRITKHTGDGVTAVFDGGLPVACALESQVRFASESWGEIGELRIRAGLHAGEAEFHPSAGTPEGDFFGPPVNATARVMSAAWGGQVLLTPEVTRASPLPPQATLLDLGEHLLKNVSAPQQLYQLDHPQLPYHEFPPPRTLSGQSIRHAVDERGVQMVGLEPQAMGIALVAATLLPSLQGELDPDSGALEGNLGVLEELGAGTLRGFVAGFAERLAGGKFLPAPEIRSLLERELRVRWQTDDESALALRGDASRLLQAVHGVEAAMTAATGEVQEALARGLADLSTEHDEFRWMLGGVQDTLADVRTHQAVQLALQREQLDLQRQQLVKTNLLLHRQPGAATMAALTVEGDVREPPDIVPVDVACPYKGLAAFEAQDAEYFFGREELVAELTARLAGTRFLAVVGPSGSGKSSLVRAGLLPAVWGGALPGSGQWRTMVLTPGAHPLNELAARLSVLGDDRATAMLQDLEADHRAVDLAVRRALVGEPERVKLLLVVDQFEEIFALCRDEGERRQFITALLYAVEAEDGRMVVVPTIRADFYGRCAEYPQLAARMSDGLLVGPMSTEELRAAIERPAAVVGLGLEPGLGDMILDDVAGEPGALPLMSHALLETFARRRGAMLTLSGYAASGGVAGAIAQTAGTVYEGLDADQQALARSIFLRLTELGEEGAQDTRRRVAPGELVHSEEEAPAIEALLRTLAGARLVTTGGGPVLSGSEGTVEVAHEALIREWPLLRGWLEEDREGLRVHRHLTEAAQEWERLGREEGELYRGARLAAAGEWQASHSEALNPLEREFLTSSRELAEREEAEREAQRQRELEAARRLAEERRQAAARLRKRALLLAGAMGVAVILAIVAFFAFRQATQNASAAQVASTQAVSERYAAETAQALEEDQRATAVAEGWARATSQVLAEEEAWARATQQAIAEEEAEARATQQAIAVAEAEARATQQAVAEEQARLATSWELAAAAVNNLAEDPELSTLLALEALATKDTLEARNALHQALPELRLLRTWVGQSLVEGLAYSPDGTRLASTSSADKTVMVRDAASGALLVTMETEQEVRDAAFSPDGRLLATSCYTETHLWDAASGELQYTLSGQHAGAGEWNLGAGHVAFSPDGSRLIVANVDGVPKVWDLSSRTASMALDGHDSVCLAADYSPDGRHLATGADDGNVRVWDAGTGVQLLSVEGHSGMIWDVAFDPEGARLLSVGDGGTLNIWDVATGENLLRVSEGAALRTAVWFPDGSRVAAGGYDGTIGIWSASMGEKLLSLAGHASTLYASAIHPDGGILATGSLTVKTWDLGPSRELECFGDPLSSASSFAYRSDGGELATVGADGTILLWDPSDGTLSRELTADQPHGWVGPAYSPDDTHLAAGSFDGVWGLWDLATGQASIYEGHDAAVPIVHFGPDGTRLVTSSFDGTVKIWDVATQPAQGGAELLLTFRGHIQPDRTSNYTFGAVFSPDGSRVASAGSDIMVRVWDPETGREILALPGAEDAGWMNCVAYSPDGRFIAGCEGKGTIRVWEADTGEVYRILPGHTATPGGLSFSADCARLASAGMDALAKVWDLESGEEIATLYGNEGILAWVQLSPDGTMVSVGSNGLVRTFTVDTDDLVELARSRVTRSLTTEECQKYLHVEECPERP